MWGDALTTLTLALLTLSFQFIKFGRVFVNSPRFNFLGRCCDCHVGLRPHDVVFEAFVLDWLLDNLYSHGIFHGTCDFIHNDLGRGVNFKVWLDVIVNIQAVG